MSNSPSTLSDQALSPELSAMDKLAKSCRSVFILIVTIFLLIIAIIVCNYTGILGSLDRLAEQPSVKTSLNGIGVVFMLYFLFVWLRFYIRVWYTPSSIVRGARFGKVFVIFALIDFIISASLNPLNNFIADEYIIILKVIIGLCGLISAIFFLIYLYRLADAISSNRIKSCVKWIVSCAVVFIILYVSGLCLENTNNNTPIVGYMGLAASVAAIIGFVSYVNSFDYAAKDISKYIEKHASNKNVD